MIIELPYYDNNNGHKILTFQRQKIYVSHTLSNLQNRVAFSLFPAPRKWQIPLVKIG